MTETLLLLVGAISTFSNRISEAIKAYLKARYPDMLPETISLVSLLTSLVAGIVGALALNANLLVLLPPSPYTANIPPLFGVLLTGCVASFGSESLHWLLDLLQARRDEMSTPLARATVETSTPAVSATASAAVTTPPADTPAAVSQAFDARLSDILRESERKR